MKLKNKLKTVVSTAIAMSIGTTMLPLSVSAELSEPAAPDASIKYYDSRDINRDGEIDIRDVVLLNRCMVGAEYISDFKQLDADTNGIVNFADSYCILAYTVGSSYSCSVDGLWSYTSGKVSNIPSLISAPTSAEYVKYNYATGTDSRYTLSLPKAYTTENSISTYGGVIGNDDREYMTNQPEFTGIVWIGVKKRNSSNDDNGKGAHSTGFIVGDHQIATAAHCVYGAYREEKDKDHFYTQNGIFLYDKDGNRTEEKLTPVEVHIPTDYIEECLDARKYNLYTEDLAYCDYALITVKEDLSKYTHFSVGLAKDPYSSAFSNASIYVSGLPDIVNSNSNTGNKIAKAYDKVYTGYKYYPDELLYCTTDMSEGDSGAPMYTITKYKNGNTEYYDYTAIGIVSGGDNDGTFNFGVKMIPLIQRFYNSNPNYSY